MGSTQVTVEIEEEGCGSKLRLTHEGFPIKEFAAKHRDGWEGSLTRLAHIFSPADTRHMATTLALHRLLYFNAMRDISTHDLVRRLNERTNSMLWIAGHVAHLRGAIAGCLGRPIASPLAIFREAISDDAAYPPWRDIAAFFSEATLEINAGLQSITPGDLARPHSRRLPINDPSMAGLLDFLLHHEAYHIGQLGFLRKFLGYQMIRPALPGAKG